MNRYYLKFYKEGYIRYTSHLDMLRLFKRSFKRAGIKLQYSQGFNPHPKMSFAQPLSLGYSSTGEYLEFETECFYNTDEIIQKMNGLMPEGVGIVFCQQIENSGKTLAALTESASYDIEIPIENPDFDVAKVIDEYMAQNSINITKSNRKSGKESVIDIKPMIRLLEGYVVNNKYILLTTKLDAGSVSNLSPELLITSFFQFAGIATDRTEVNIKRTDIIFCN